jgi:hypothetical protein
MLQRKQYIITLPVLSAILLTGCFEEDEKVAPHIPGDEISYEFTQSMYTHQAFFDLGTNSVQSENENGMWVLKFGARAGDWQVGINSADYYGVYPTGTTREESVEPDPPVEEWVFDHTNGDPDSSAFAGWVHFEGNDTLYSGELFLIGQYDGISYKASHAVKLLGVNESGYIFRMKAWPSGEWTEYEVIKSGSYNSIYFSFAEENTYPDIEPEMNNWDLLFTQYGTILYTNDGEPTPYFVRGVLLNPYTVAVALDTVTPFPDITSVLVESYTFSPVQDVIGHEWKDVDVDVTSGTAVYAVIPGITYVIKDTEGYFYKMRFISFYNDKIEKGYPVIEHARL